MPGALFFGSVSFVQTKEMNAQRQRNIFKGNVPFQGNGFFYFFTLY